MWCGQVIVMATSILHSTRIPLPEGLVGCIMTGRGEYLAAFWLAPLAMDTVITTLTVFKTLKYLRQQHGHIELVKIILRDGLLYFAVILVANLSNCLVYYLAPPDLKVIGASFSQIITIMMISRLQLNLRSDSICSPGVFTSRLDQTFTLPHDNRTSEPSGTSTFSSSLSRFFASTVAELGKDIGDPHDDILEEKPAKTRIVEVIPEDEIEMAPILPARGGMPPNEVFSPEAIECLEAVIQVSPRIVEG
ncbi:hypothetical protein FRC08_015121 [Ceratobasidium sp. 394]|nr:hypothetical protein FRC08_015121 [Ceratobasidium sp. 394]